MSLPSEGHTKFRGDISIAGWDITTFGFEIQTSAILEFYFLFRSRPVRHNLHVILHQAIKFRPNRSTHGRNMTSYPFFKMAAATTKYYFRFPICWCHCLQKVKVYQQTQFRPDISIGGWDIITFGFEIQTSAILEFYFRFRSQKVKICQQTKFRRPQWSTYIDLWLRYNNFWFGKTNLYHIGILLPVPISTISP